MPRQWRRQSTETAAEGAATKAVATKTVAVKAAVAHAAVASQSAAEKASTSATTVASPAAATLPTNGVDRGGNGERRTVAAMELAVPPVLTSESEITVLPRVDRAPALRY